MNQERPWWRFCIYSPSMVGIPFRACVFCHLLGSRFWGGRVSHRLKQMAETREPSSLTMCEDIQLHVRAQKKESLSLYFPCPEENAAAAPCHSCRPPLEPHSAACHDEGELHKVTGVRRKARPKSHTCVRKSPEVAKYKFICLFSVVYAQKQH